MITRTVVGKLVIFALVTALGIGYVLVHYVHVDRPLLGTGYTAYVDLGDSGGIFSTASVTYRGVEIGRVGSIRLRPHGIRVALDITSSDRIPADARAVVGDGSAIGEQFVDLQPQSDHGPYLHDGSVIPQDRTQLPVSSQTLLVNLDRLVNSVPKSALRDLISQLGAAFNNTGPSLATLLDQTKALLSTATSDVPQTTRLIGDSSTVLATQIALSNDILSFSRHLASLSGQLRTADGAVRRIITEGVPTATEVSQLVNSVDATLPVVVSNLITVGQMAAVRIPGLREILIIYPYVVATSFGLFPGGGTRFGVPLPTPQNSNPQPCLTGYLPPSQWRLPSDLRYPPIRWHSFCTAPVASNTGPRGSREGPDPSGGRLGNDPSYQHSDGVPHANATQPGTPGSSYTGSAGTSYDLASTGGQQWMMMGEPSWSYLLLAPLVW